MITSLQFNKSELIEAPLWFHKRGLMQTASGYGKNLKTEYKVKYHHRIRRIILLPVLQCRNAVYQGESE